MIHQKIKEVAVKKVTFTDSTSYGGRKFINPNHFAWYIKEKVIEHREPLWQGFKVWILFKTKERKKERKKGNL